MKKSIIKTVIASIVIGLINGCSIIQDDVLNLEEDVGNSSEYVNHYDKPYFEITTSEDIEDVVAYLPKETTTVRVKMKISNLEDIIYMKLVTEDGYEIDKILRRVEDIKLLGYKQDGYLYEPSVEKNVVTLQIFVPSIYLLEGIYKPKLVFSFKRNARSVQEVVQFNFAKHIYAITKENELKQEAPAYVTLKDYCSKAQTPNSDFFVQMSNVNENRLDIDTIKDIENLCK